MSKKFFAGLSLTVAMTIATSFALPASQVRAFSWFKYTNPQELGLSEAESQTKKIINYRTAENGGVCVGENGFFAKASPNGKATTLVEYADLERLLRNLPFSHAAVIRNEDGFVDANSLDSRGKKLIINFAKSVESGNCKIPGGPVLQETLKKMKIQEGILKERNKHIPPSGIGIANLLKKLDLSDNTSSCRFGDFDVKAQKQKDGSVKINFNKGGETHKAYIYGNSPQTYHIISRENNLIFKELLSQIRDGGCNSN